MKTYEKALKKTNAVVLSDYGKGTLSDSRAIIKAAKKLGIPVLVDPKGNDFSVYRGATLITPNRKEFEAVVGPCPDDATLTTKARHLLRQTGIEGLLITRGAEGMTLIFKGKKNLTIPTQAQDVFDVTGAGDTVISVMAMALGSGHSLENAMQLANAAAGVVVSKVGTATVSLQELSHAMHVREPIPTGIIDEETLASVLKRAHLQGEKVVMTNGCFDLLHAGHVNYLTQAKALGDRLIVAVNTDDSVKQLKGESRPLNTLKHRMDVLAALSVVDWVVPFSENTPKRLIKKLLPDILIKGADYKISDIAGAEEIIANGGQVKTIKLIPGCSTSILISKAQNLERNS